MGTLQNFADIMNAFDKRIENPTRRTLGPGLDQEYRRTGRLGITGVNP